jgi:predicted lipoprotein with Yx(FWY)xxD motif
MKPTRTLAGLLAMALVVAACGTGDAGQTDTTAGDDDAATTTTRVEETSTTQGQETTTTSEGTDDTSSTEMDGVHLSETDLGEVLVGPDGFTLYVFTNDTGGESVCYESCAQLWPPVPGETPISSELDADMFGTTTRDDGSEQLTVNDMPLYWYQSDLEPGETNGQGFNGVWFVIDDGGSMVELSGAGSEDTSTDDSVIDYDY